MAGNLVVAARRDGQRLKGRTFDFLPNREHFHLQCEDGTVQTLAFAELKALYFVRDLAGNQAYETNNAIDVRSLSGGRKIRVTFGDQEELLGTTHGYDPSRKGFFVAPADPVANNERVFVIASAAERVELL